MNRSTHFFLLALEATANDNIEDYHDGDDPSRDCAAAAAVMCQYNAISSRFTLIFYLLTEEGKAKREKR